MRRIILGLLIISLSLGVLVWKLPKNAPPSQPVKIGYFHGGRTTLLYRAYAYGEFEKENVTTKLFTKGLYETSYSLVSKNISTVDDGVTYGRVTGIELIDEMMKGHFDAVTTGEDSFLKAVSRGLPIVAVARMGRGIKDEPHRVILFRSDISINKPEDIKGKILGVRRAGPGDKTILLEYLHSVGLDPEKDVTIIENIPDDTLDEYMRNKRIDGAFYHVMAAIKLVQDGTAYIYKGMDWVNPEIVGALLVFRKDFVSQNPTLVEKVIRVYMRRIKLEKSLSQQERISSGRKQKGLRMETDFPGVNLPQYDFPPLVSRDLLEEAEGILLKNRVIDRKTDIANFVDNSFVEKIYKEFK